MRGAFRNYGGAAVATLRIAEIKDWGSVNASAGYLFSHLRQRPLGIDLALARPLPGTTSDQALDPKIINQPGVINVFQFRMEFPTPNKAVVFPLSFTHSNRKDLIKESDVRVNFGFTIRFDSLLNWK